MKGRKMKRKSLLLASLLIAAVIGNVDASRRTTVRPGVRRVVPRRNVPTAVDPTQIRTVKNVVLVRETCPGNIVATKLDDGKTLIGWKIKNQAQQWVGEGTFYTPSLQKMGPTVYYTMDSTYGQKATAFSDGKVLIAMPNKFVIINQQGKIVRGPTQYDDEKISDISVTTLSGGKTAVIAYHREVGPRGSGRYLVVSNGGKILVGPEVFGSQGKTTYISATTLPNGLINLAYNCSGSKTKVIDVFNNAIVGEHKFHAKRIYGIESVVLDDGNILLAYVDQDSKGQCMVVKPSGLKVSGPHGIHPEKVRTIRLAKMANGNVCLAFTLTNKACQCAIVDTNGQVIKGPNPVFDGYRIETESFDCVHLRDNMVMIPLSAIKSGSNDLADRIGAYAVVK